MPVVKYRSTACQTPKCENVFLTRVDNKSKSLYCLECKKNYPLTLLKLQTEHCLRAPELLVEIATTFNFHSAEFVASVLNVSRKKFVEWLKLYLEVDSWNEFKKEFFCKSSSCYIFDTKDFKFTSNKYYLIHKLKKDLHVCSCIYKLSGYEKTTSRPRIIKNLMESKKGKTINKDSMILIRITNIETLEKVQRGLLEKFEQVKSVKPSTRLRIK